MRVRVPLLAGLLALAGCVAPPPENLVWRDVTPDGVVPATVAVVDGRVLVGGTDGSGQAPAVIVLGAAAVALDPQEPYAASAEIDGVAGDGGELFLLGGRAGGAHANTRWTVWDGTVAGSVTSRPQEFFTFGGHDAGPLLGTVVVGGEPIIVGSRGGDAGPYGALYSRSGEVWHQLDTPAALQSEIGAVLGFTAATSAGDQVVLVGDVVSSTAKGVTQTPVLYRGTVRGAWRRVDLPVPGSVTGLRHATSVACSAEECAVAGWAGGPVLWRVRLDDDAITSRVLVGDAAPGVDPAPLVVLGPSGPVVLTDAATPTAAYTCGGSWFEVPGPGRAVAAAVSGRDVYVVAGGRLLRTTLTRC